jgi:tetratricopeptide (TPR) repeat protein
MKRIHFINLVIAGGAFAAEPLPLSTSYWNDPAFLKSFNGSYRIEARIEPSVTTEERGLLVEVQKLMASGKRNDAILKLRDSSLIKDSPALTFNLGNLLFETGDTAMAIRAYESALEAYPSFRRAHHNLALALVRENDLAKALTHLTEAVRLGDSEGSTYGLLGYCRLARKEYASALQSYRLAQITEPDVPEWKAGIAQCLQNLDAKAEAAALLNEVIRQRPDEASYSVLQANILLELGQPDRATKALELPFRLGKLDPSSSLLLADLHLRADRKPAAKQAIDSAFSRETKPSAQSILRLIATASGLSDWPLVKELMEKTADDASRPLRFARARYLIASAEDPTAGEALLRQLTTEDPTDGTALLALANHLAGTSRPDAAELIYERATTDPGTAYEARIGLARLHVSQSRYADALEDIDAALALQPGEELQTYRSALQNTISASE